MSVSHDTTSSLGAYLTAKFVSNFYKWQDYLYKVREQLVERDPA